MKSRLSALFVALCLASGPLFAADPAPAVPVQVVAAPADVASVDAILAAMYDTISGPSTKVRDWNRLRSLFPPEGRMGVIGPKGLRLMTLDDYIARVTPVFAKDGFFESEAHRVTEQFGALVHVFSTYEARHAADEAKPFLRGINSVQLVNDGQRWYVVNVIWHAEDDKTPLPQRYVKK